MNTDPKLHRLYRPKFLEGTLLSSDDIKPRICRMCPTKLAPNVKYYCCGDHMNMAKLDGSYGHEEDSPPQPPAESEPAWPRDLSLDSRLARSQKCEVRGSIACYPELSS